MNNFVKGFGLLLVLFTVMFVPAFSAEGESVAQVGEKIEEQITEAGDTGLSIIILVVRYILGIAFIVLAGWFGVASTTRNAEQKQAATKGLAGWAIALILYLLFEGVKAIIGL